MKVDQEYSESDRRILHIKLSRHEMYRIGIVKEDRVNTYPVFQCDNVMHVTL